MLTVENISCQKGYTVLFERVSFYLKSGDIARISGANGRGKTSLLKIIAGISPFEGEITLDGATPGERAYKEQLLYLGHQSLIHKQLSVRENLEFLHHLTSEVSHKEDYAQALAQVGLDNYGNELGHTLSAGQQRRIILATLFLSNAKVWLLDEPFTALDVDIVATIERKIQEFCQQGGICIFTTHQATTLDAQEICL